MSEKELIKYIERMKKYTEKISNESPKDSLNSLVKVGICTPKGNLRKAYK